MLKLLKITYSQKTYGDGAQAEEPSLTIQIEPMKGGDYEYLVVHANHWVIENRSDIDKLHAKLAEMLEECDC